MLRGNSEDLILAVLKAFERVGDASALPSVERLATALGKTSAERRIREAALECLPFLRWRIEQMHATQTLLRSANPPDTPPAVLLRPSYAPCVPANARRSVA